MRKYCKAYYLKDIRRFDGWHENNAKDESKLSDDDIVYLWDDLTVVKSPIISDKGILLDVVTPEWRDFCQTVLKFEIPEDLRNRDEQPAEIRKASNESVEEQSPTSR